MFTLVFGNGYRSEPITAEQLNNVFDNGIMGCGGAGRIEQVIVDATPVAWPVFKAIYNAALACEYDERAMR